MSTTTTDLASRIEGRRARVAVVGLGYVGLPLATAFCKAGFPVTGIDVDRQRVEDINAGRSYIGDVPSDKLARLVKLDGAKGTLRATADFSEIRNCDVVFICVPTPIDTYKTPDLSYIVTVSETIATHMSTGCLVVLQSTTYPGTTEDLVRPVLEKHGLRAGADFHLAFSPERIDPGNARWTAENTPRVVGGLTPRCAELAASLLDKISPEVCVVSSPRTAEMTKLLENIFRVVNIALVNELALLCEQMGLDMGEVVGAAATKPFGFMPFYPGPGVGGHCIPVDPYYLSWKAKEYDLQTRFIDLAADTNHRMPHHAVELVSNALGDRGLRGAKILVIGVAFKPDVGDVRNSPALKVVQLLTQRGGEVSYHDPYVSRCEVQPNPFSPDGRVLESVPLDDEILAKQDCLVILVKHRGIEYDRLVSRSRLVVDAVDATRGLPGLDGKVVRLGVGSKAAPATAHVR